jgi:hypothetical protein
MLRKMLESAEFKITMTGTHSFEAGISTWYISFSLEFQDSLFKRQISFFLWKKRNSSILLVPWVKPIDVNVQA